MDHKLWLKASKIINYGFKIKPLKLFIKIKFLGERLVKKQN